MYFDPIISGFSANPAQPEAAETRNYEFVP
jgi:hypothetical protein